MGFEGPGLFAVRVAATFAAAWVLRTIVERPVRFGGAFQGERWHAPVAAFSAIGIVLVVRHRGAARRPGEHGTGGGLRPERGDLRHRRGGHGRLASLRWRPPCPPPPSPRASPTSRATTTTTEAPRALQAAHGRRLHGRRVGGRLGAVGGGHELRLGRPHGRAGLRAAPGGVRRPPSRLALPARRRVQRPARPDRGRRQAVQGRRRDPDDREHRAVRLGAVGRRPPHQHPRDRLRQPLPGHLRPGARPADHPARRADPRRHRPRAAVATPRRHRASATSP